MRIIDLINAASNHLRDKGFDNARLDVQLLLGSVLGLSRIGLYMEFERSLSEGEVEEFRRLYRRRLSHEPLQYIIGSAGFREIEVQTDRRGLIPRPETELLVQEAVDFLRGRPDPLVADLGTGTGVIAISVAYEVPGARVVAVDISDEALLLTEQNARRAGVGESITLVCGDMLEGLGGRGPFDAILSNPPYVRTGDIETLQPEIRDYEPRIALDGGTDGMKYLEPVARGAHEHLMPGGLLLLECGAGQAPETAEILSGTGRYSGVEIIKDLMGRDRVVKAVSK